MIIVQNVKWLGRKTVLHPLKYFQLHHLILKRLILNSVL